MTRSSGYSFASKQIRRPVEGSHKDWNTNPTKYKCPSCGSRMHSRRGGSDIYDCEKYQCGKTYLDNGLELEEYNYVGRFD